ncbi:hypothetical protein SCATT_50180 [Streptantibioticus cattleyicolor NRRL 8057 = DSM 46488]|uniref:Uncharacterized protein n=1 Tax=Streptantibioticus cattleyicolor (strain ATCC 35852 / DSM 46488 / JCM 4925 / NBRC 14057 / NRRL 8057) TaxID=1003195 RepID=F8K0I6_STREN|nr:hypothetical protein SCATT_50180 [Streptantibioticus cattleyicolor NRRL 8057 = DSM 46488]MYS61836.1 hypothetical protein [Streptomyces sp. SID5468]CCB77714.1 conserved protein of unknown function [Streptantibioticus cattleyicolor NRRL 8057 = DSM 46488]
MCPPGAPGFVQSAKAWLFDLAPARWRYEEALHTHPAELATMIRLHLEAEITAVQTRLRTLRGGAPADGGGTPAVTPAVPEACAVYAREHAWACAMLDQVRLIEDALITACRAAAGRRRAGGAPRRAAVPAPRPATG